RHPAARPRPAGAHALRREPAEGRARPVARRRPPAAPPRRTHPRGRHRGAGRALPADPPPRRRRHRRPARLQRGARGARPRRPGARAPRGRGHPRGGRPRPGRTHRTGHDHGGECEVTDARAPGEVSPPVDERPARRAAARQAWPGAALLGRIGRNHHLGLVAVLLLLAVVGLVTAPENFATTSNLVSILALASTIGVITVGMTFVIIGGGIDLSVGAIMALASVWATTLATQSYGPLVMAMCAILVGTGAGLVNGFLVAYGRMAPFIATLATLVAARGLA